MSARLPLRARRRPPPLTLTETWNPAAVHPGVVLNDAPCGVVQASPVAFNDGGTPAVEVGDRQGNLYGLNLQDGSVAPGWGSGSGSTVGPADGCVSNPAGGTPAVGIDGVQIPGSPPVDSTASVTGNGNLYFGAGNAASPVDGGYYAYAPNGSELWNQVVTNPPTDSAPDGGVQASLPIARRWITGRRRLARPDDLRAQRGERRTGPRVAAVLRRQRVLHRGRRATSTARDRTTSRSAARPSAGFALGTHYANGGHVRIYNDHGGRDLQREHQRGGRLLPRRRAHPARRCLRHRHRHRQLLPGRQRREHGEGVRHASATRCGARRSTAPREAARLWPTSQGNGQLAVVEGTVKGQASGSVWALNAATGSVIWQTSLPGAVYGSVTTADLNGSGAQDVIVPTDQGLYILDGPTGSGRRHVDDGSGNGGTRDATASRTRRSSRRTPTASIGITVAGYFAVQQRQLRAGHRPALRGDGLDAANADAAGGWPQFHHDAVADRIRRGWRAARDLQPPRGGAERLSDRGLRRRDLRLRAGLLREHREHGPEQARGRHGGRRPDRAATGWWRPTAGSSRTATPASSARPGPSSSTSPSWAWRPPLTEEATGWSPPTAASSPTATPASTAPPPPSPGRTSSGWRRPPTASATGR